MQIVIDWLQVNCIGHLTERPLFKVTSTGKHSQIFANIEEITYRDEIIAISASKPFSSILHPDTHIVKFSNKILYDPEFPNIYNTVVKKMGLMFRSITRIDLAHDFNEFANHRSPEILIRNYLSQTIEYQNRTLVQMRGRSNYNFTPDYLRFGTQDSLVSPYLYRKNLEMRQKIWKPWISKNWKLNKLDTCRDIWRLEFSLKGGKHSYCDKDTGETCLLNPDIYFNSSQLFNLYFTLVEKYFRFCYVVKGSHRSKKTEIKLFNEKYNPFYLFIASSEKDSTRADRIMIKKLEKLNWELRLQKNPLAPSAADLAQHIADSKGLNKYHESVKYIIPNENESFNRF